MIAGLNNAGKILVHEKGCKPRACIVFNKKTNFLPVSELCSEDTVVAYVEVKGQNRPKVLFCSAYLPGEKQDPTEELTKVVDYARRQKSELIVGCDANAHHTIWGSTGINKRGELLSDFLLSNCLYLLNNGHTPTFVTIDRKY